MNWTGKSSVFWVAVLALVLTGLCGAARAEVLQPQAGEESAFFYPSFPLEGGPYITAASFWNGAGSADSLIVVFSEPIDDTELAIEDFVFHGFEASTLERVDGATAKYAVLSGFTGTVSASVDSIGLVWGSVVGLDASLSKDIGMVPVMTGPAIVDVIFEQHFNSEEVQDPYADDSMYVEVIFDHDVTLTAPTGNVFRITPELAPILLANTVSDNVVTIRKYTGGSNPDSMRWLHPGIAKLWLEASDVYWTDLGSSALNSKAQKVVVQNFGPALMAAYYNDQNTGTIDDDQVWLVYDQPLPEESLGSPSGQYYPGWDTTGFDAAAEQGRHPSGAFYSNVVVITNPVTNDGPAIPGEGTEWIVEDSGIGDVQFDYQEVDGTRRMVRCQVGVGITRAAYFDRGTDNPADDQLHIWFSEMIETADVTAEDFVLVPYIPSWQSQVIITRENINGVGHVVIAGWNNVTALAGARLPNGNFIRLAADDAFDGLSTQEGCDGVSMIPIFDDSEPARVSLEEVAHLTYKRYNEVTEADTVFLAWRETGTVDDSDQYFLFFTNQEPAATPLDDIFIQNYRHNAKALGNLTPITVDNQVQRIALDITRFGLSGATTTDGFPIEHGDQLRFMLVPATYWGVMADADVAALHFETTIIAGPVCPPQDWDENDDDIIHVEATYAPVGDPLEDSWTRVIYGDANAAPCGSWVYIFDRCWEGEPGDAVELGRGLINPNKSFNEITLDDSVVDPDTLNVLYVYAWDDGAWSTCLPILNDIVAPDFLLVDGAIQHADRFNPPQIYKAEDYVNILLKAVDHYAEEDTALSDLLAITADFTNLDDRDALPAGLGGHPLLGVPLVSLGYDELDNDGDWVANDPTIDLDDDGVMDFPEPFVDENGNGVFDLGETFVDLDGDDQCDCIGGSGDDFDLNLDSADPDEHGFYEIRLLATGDADRWNDVIKGFRVLDPVTDPEGQTNFGEILDIPVPFSVTDTYLDTEFEYQEEDAPFLCEMDEVPPTVSKVTELYQRDGFTGAAGSDNLIIPTDPVYNLGRYFDFLSETPSDEDVLFSVVEVQESGSRAWMQLTLDPAGWNVDPGIPGVAEFDDDRDWTAATDADEDGDVDEFDWIDLGDPEVVDAIQDSTADANADAGDGIYRTTDRRDNDNDAFFIFEPYFDVDGLLGSSLVTQKVVWFNIDETTANDIDDDGNGIPDNAGEVESYDAQSDDNEDGIFDGEAVALTADGARHFCVFDSTYNGDFYVDAAHQLGEHGGDADDDIRGLTEFVPYGFGVIDANHQILTDGALPGLPWGDDAVATEFGWNAEHGENVDWWHLAQIYYGEIPDGSQQYDLRVVAYDQPGNFNPAWAVPFSFTSDVTPPEVWLTDCPEGGLPADFGDGVICPEGSYTLTVENLADVTKVYFQRRISTAISDTDTTWGGWAAVGEDESLPFTAEWDASEVTIPNDPPDAFVLVEFRAYAQDEFGNVQDVEEACVAQVRVEDCQAPWTWFTLIHETANPNNDVPDVMNPPDTGSLPNPYYYRDVIGPLQVPRGPAIDIWALFSPGEGLASTTEHDVIRVVFEISLAGTGVWTPFATVTGHIDPDDMSIDLTLPVAVTLETEALETGTYDIRVYACDIEGNNCEPADQAPVVQYDIAKITIVEEGLRAYIEPLRIDCEVEEFDPSTLDLYAINWIHDYYIDHVLFQYSEDGTTWHDIATDDGNSADPRGDIVLRRGMALLDTLSGRVAFRTEEMFIDYDGDGYSERDPIVFDDDADGVFDWTSADYVVLGDLDEIIDLGVFDLTAFPQDEFHTGVGDFEPTQWIFRENQSTIDPAQATGTLNLWHVEWDITGLDLGTYWVRAVATDDMYATDSGDIPTTTVSLDALAPAAMIATVTTPDGVEQAAVNDLYFDATVEWVKICATSADTDLSEVLLQFRIPGHAVFGDWHDLDINDDEDFYADIDGIPGLSAEDEIFLDTGTVPFVWDAGDLPIYLGANGELNADDMATPPALIPNMAFYTAAGDTLFEEDGAGDPDDDNDGMSNEDLFNGDDWYGPYCVYFLHETLGLISDTNIEFRAVATDQSCNEDPDPVVVRFMFGETDEPETDVVWAKLADGTEIDVLPLLSDGTDVTELYAADIADPVDLLVTGEDETAITRVDLLFRKVGECYDLMEWENPWLSMSAEGFTTERTNYDYPFAVDLEMLAQAHGYGIYEFFPQAEDNEGNLTPPPENPYRFKIMLNEATITTAGGTVAPGDEYWFTAELDFADAGALVSFLYAERILDVAIDATRITPDPDHATFQTLPLDMPMYGPATNAILTVNGVAGTFYLTADELIAEGGAGDWTYDAGAQAIEFAVLPAPTDEILVSYNLTGYDYLWADGPGVASTDEVAPYTAAWDAAFGHNVPFPVYDETEAYDVIAVVAIGEDECGLSEHGLSEGLLLLLEDELAPNAMLYGGGLIYTPEPDDEYWPGNPSYDSVAGLIEWKLSGIEHEFFATSDSQDVATMEAIFIGDATDTETVVAMTLYDEGADFVPMTFTLYQSDFFDVPYDFENVVLHINGFDYELAETVLGNGIWQVGGVPVPVGAVTEYYYSIDQVGNDWFDTFDRRNYKTMVPPGPGGISYFSTVHVPAAPFWYAPAPSFGTTTSVWQVKAQATDTEGNVGTSHLYTFVYDPVAPAIEEVTADALRFGAGDDVTTHAIISDPVPATFDVITVEALFVQYCPNYAAPEADRVWLDFGADTDPSDGWAVESDIDDRGDADGFDNDGDGEWDEADEATSAMAWRFFAQDDGGNVSAPVVLPFTLDDTPPVVALTAPAMGAVYPFGTAFDVSADITDDEDDTAYVQFWYAADLNIDGNPIWLPVDITPEDNTDHTFDTTAPYLVEFLTTNYLDELDTYVRFKAEARDGAGNSGWSEEVLIVVNDITGPTAFPWTAQTTGGDPLPLSDPHLAVTGHGVVISGTAVDPSGRENLAWVRVQYEAPDADAWQDIAIVPSGDFVLGGYNDFTVGWSVTWDVVAPMLPEGVYHIRAIAGDFDDNYDQDPITGTLRIDHTAPEVLYELADSDYHGFPSYYQGHQEPVLYWAYYENDGVPEHASMALRPDHETGDMAFTIVTRSADIAGIDLQMHQEGTHGLGEWITYQGAHFDFEPNLTFQQGGQTYYVWWMRIDDARDVLEGIGLAGVVEVRALAYDYAGNENILHDEKNDWQAWTIDIDDPSKIDFHHNLEADQVASGDPVTFGLVLTDATTDVASVMLEYSVSGEDAWTVIDPNPATPEIESVVLTGENIDTPFARWNATVTWTTPYPLVQDTAYDVRATFYDTPGWHEHEMLTITVEDNIKPEFTKIWAIPAAVKWVDDTYYGESGDGYEVDCEGEVEHDGLYIDLNADAVFGEGDVAIDAGLVFGGYVALWDGTENIGNVIGAATNTWPRYIDEIVLGGDLEKMVSHEVVLVARTQIDDTGLERVEFWAENEEGERVLIGTDECVPAYAMGFYLWQVRWNTLEVDQYGDPIYPDGVYTIVPVAYDLEGNVEEWGRDLSGAAVVTVDNTAPEATVSVVPATVERNEILSLRAETDVLGLQDDEITFLYKRSTDLNMDASWMLVPGDEGVDDSDINPDWTRPYVFDWDLDKMDVPFPLEDPIVGLTYHVAGHAADILGNHETVAEAFEAGRYATFTVVDTKAPVATITKIERITGDTTPITNPHLMGTIHARDLAYLKAKILGFENDTEIVEFMWAPVGDTTPMLIDAQVTKDPDDPYTWRIHSWDLSPLAGQTIEVFAVATDDVGNSDFNETTGRPIAGPVFTLFVDYAVPVVAVQTPTDDMKECRVDTENRFYDLVFTSGDADIDVESVLWEYKLSRYEDDPANWTPCVLTAPGVVWDVNSETFAAAWDILGESEVPLIASELYDVSLTVVDVAGNVTRSIVAERVVIDVDEPWGQITRVDVEGESFYPTLAIDVTTGDTIDLWATAHDVEEGLPLGTGVAEVIFQVYGPLENDGPDMTWRDIGFWHAPDDELPHEEVSTSVTWNTSGIGEGTYSVRIMVADEECNTYESGVVTLVISDIEPPRARIAGFDPWQIPHGDDPTTYCDVYAVAYSDSVIAEVQFQYSTDGTNWIPFGITRDIEDDVPNEHSDWADDMCDLWYATIDLRTFAVGDQVWFRAIAKDEVPNQDPTPPTVLTEVVQYPDGSLDLAAVDTLPDLTSLDAVLEGGTDPDDFVVQVQMGRADQRPYVLYLPPIPVGEGGQPWCVEMVRMIDTEFSTKWQGAVEWDYMNCGKSTIFAGALSDDLEIDLHVKHIWSWDIDYVLGSNGTAHVPGYVAIDDTPEEVDYLYATAMVPTSSGEGDYDGCLMLFPSVTPALSPDEVRYLEMIPRTGYAMGLIEDEIHEQQPGYPWTLSIQYDEAGLQAAAAAAGVDPATVEEYLTVRAYNWYDDVDFGRMGWTGDDISFIDVDTVTNTVTFKVDSWCYLRPHFALFVPKWDAPVVVRSFTPWSPYADRWNYTDCDPKILIDLNASGLDEIDPYTIEVYIDGNHVASWMESGEWAEGNGDIDVQQKNFEGTRYQVYYQHSTNRAWWLTEGEHTLNVMFKYVTGTEDWVSLPATAEGATFFVDNTAPYIEFHGGWVDNPLLRNVAGYLNPYKMENMLTVYMYDEGAGILVRPEHLYPLFGSDDEGDDGDSEGYHEDIIEDDAPIGDPGIKYDLWLVHDEDDQVEVDEIEERLLLHPGTADEIIPYITPLLFADEGAYTPADTMVVRLPIVAGGRTHDIQDGDIIEVTLYSKKHIEHMEDFTAGCDVGLIVNYDPDLALSDTLATFYIDCYYDRATGLHVYDRGIYDWAGNSGSKYVEQRFIVDMSAPTARLIDPAVGWVEPGRDFDFEIMLEDDGAGVASATAKLVGPDGAVIEDGVTIAIVGDKITGRVIGGLPAGVYNAVVDVTDKAGNTTTLSVPIVVEAATLALSNTYVTPNPSNPAEGATTINFTLTRSADVTIKVYDFAGEFVGTLLSNHHFGAQNNAWPWAGVAPDGTPLANGAYMIRIEAYDGTARKTAVVKAVLWRE